MPFHSQLALKGESFKSTVRFILFRDKLFQMHICFQSSELCTRAGCHYKPFKRLTQNTSSPLCFRLILHLVIQQVFLLVWIVLLDLVFPLKQQQLDRVLGSCRNTSFTPFLPLFPVGLVVAVVSELRRRAALAYCLSEVTRQPPLCLSISIGVIDLL